MQPRGCANRALREEVCEMDVRREIVFPAEPAEVWEALTEPERLEDWFATEVELEPRPGGRGVFRWGNGEERTVSVAEVDPRRLLSLRGEEGGGGGRLTAGAGARGNAPRRRRVVSRVVDGPRAAGARGVRSRVDAVFQALPDPHRRFVLETLAGNGPATVTELAAAL